MKNNFIKKILIVLPLILLITFLYFYFENIKNEGYKSLSNENISQGELIKIEIPTKKDRVKDKNTEEIKLEKENIPDEKNISVSILVEESIYHVDTAEGSNVYQSMVKLAEQNKNFSFTSKEYSGMGHFVDSINGIPGSPGKYWIYYINNKKPSSGISQVILKNGDIIKWSQEGF